MALLALLMLLQDSGNAEDLLLDAVRRHESGGEPMELLEKTVAAFDAEIRETPDRAPCYAGRGTARLLIGRIQGTQGKDPAAVFASALADFSRALELDPRHDAALAGRGDVRVALATERRLRGEEVRREDLESAITDFNRAIEIDAGRASSWAGRGLARQQAALMRFQQQRAFDAQYAASLKDLDEAVRLEPSRAYWRFLRGEARYLLAVHLGYRAEDNRPAYRLAAEDYREAEKLDPKSLPLYRDHLKIAELHAAAAAPSGVAKAERHIVWAHSWEQALLEAKGRNVPVWIYVSGGAG